MAVEAGITKIIISSNFVHTNYFQNTVLVFLNCIKKYVHIAECQLGKQSLVCILSKDGEFVLTEFSTMFQALKERKL